MSAEEIWKKGLVILLCLAGLLDERWAVVDVLSFLTGVKQIANQLSRTFRRQQTKEQQRDWSSSINSDSFENLLLWKATWSYIIPTLFPVSLNRVKGDLLAILMANKSG